MYTISQRKFIEGKIFNNTPIDTIISAQEKYNGIEVTGYAGEKIMNYKILSNGKVIKK